LRTVILINRPIIRYVPNGAFVWRYTLLTGHWFSMKEFIWTLSWLHFFYHLYYLPFIVLQKSRIN